MRQRIVFIALLGLLTAACGLKVPIEGQGFGELTGADQSLDGTGDGGAGGGTQAAGPGGADGTGPNGVSGNASDALDGAQKKARDVASSGTSLFPNDTEGLTDKTIRICTHVPITGAAPVDRNPKRFGAFYFDWLNQTKGGIHGRKVEYLTYDDRYNPANAVQAAERCRSAGSFIIAGAAGTDQLVAVAKWARDKKVPYLMGPASVKDIAQYQPYAKMVGPDYEYQHQLLADYLVKEFGKDVNYGMLRVASPFFDAAHDAYVAALKKHGITLAVDERVQKDENTFTTIFTKLRTNNVRVVNNFTTPILWLKMMKQRPPDYQPTWTAVSPTAGYNLVAEILAGEGGGSSGDALVFHHFNPAYPAAKTDSGSTLDRYPYKAEIERFQEIFRSCGVCQSEADKKTPRDDIDWSAYLAAKAIHRFLEKAGPDLTRTKVWTMLDSYKETKDISYPACPADFTRAPHRGAWYLNVFKLGTRQWEPVADCVDRT